ncbi:putative trichohyalin [Histomonas meleagridis]|nr:putative trichohyalin [Histomonas meleagridis]
MKKADLEGLYREKVSFIQFYSFLNKLDIPETELHSYETICPYRDSINWVWELSTEKSKITVILKNVEPSNVSVTENTISSPKLSGEWWAPIEDIDISFKDNSTILTFHPTAHFPLLIRGGSNVDPHSMFFLAMFSIRHSRLDFFKQWGTMSAFEGEPNAQYFMGKYFLNVQDYPNAVFWLSHSVLDHGNEDCTSELAKFLWTVESNYRNPVLAENLLCGLCRNGNPNSFLELGKMYLHGCKGFKSQPKKGKILLKFVVDVYKSQEAKKLLDEFDDTSLVDYAIATVAVLAVAACGYFGWKKFITRRK